MAVYCLQRQVLLTIQARGFTPLHAPVARIRPPLSAERLGSLCRSSLSLHRACPPLRQDDTRTVSPCFAFLVVSDLLTPLLHQTRSFTVLIHEASGLPIVFRGRTGSFTLPIHSLVAPGAVQCQTRSFTLSFHRVYPPFQATTRSFTLLISPCIGSAHRLTRPNGSFHSAVCFSCCAGFARPRASPKRVGLLLRFTLHLGSVHHLTLASG